MVIISISYVQYKMLQQTYSLCPTWWYDSASCGQSEYYKQNKKLNK